MFSWLRRRCVTQQIPAPQQIPGPQPNQPLALKPRQHRQNDGYEWCIVSWHDPKDELYLPEEEKTWSVCMVYFLEDLWTQLDDDLWLGKEPWRGKATDKTNMPWRYMRVLSYCDIPTGSRAPPSSRWHVHASIYHNSLRWLGTRNLGHVLAEASTSE